MRGNMICFDKEKIEIKCYKLLKLPIKNNIIIKKSIELYNEEEPCIIYKTAIINQIGLNILRLAESNNLVKDFYNIAYIDELTEGVIGFPKGTEYVSFN